jgi:hypothetical protein
MSHASAQFQADRLSQFIGWKVEDVTVDQDGEMFGLILSKGKMRTVIWILQDDEGNGPGSIEIQKIPIGTPIN